MELTVFENDEPRIQDLRLGEMLEYERPRKIRDLIQSNLAELESYGTLPRHGATLLTGNGARTEVQEYWLSEAQALLLTMKAGTTRAAECRKELIHLFQTWRQGRLAPRSQITLADISDVVRREVEPVRREVSEVRKDLVFLTGRVDDIVPRREFPKEVKQQFRFVSHRLYGGDCPCCRQKKVIDDNCNRIDGAHYDHFNGRERNRAEDGWLVCAKCNYRLQNDADFKERSRAHFRVFQDNLKQVCLPIKVHGKGTEAPMPDLFGT